MFWDTLPGVIASWAAAAAGIVYLARILWKAVGFGWRTTAAVARLAAIGGEDDWPNGSHSLSQAMCEIYDRQSDTHDLLKTHLEEGRTRWIHHLEEFHGQTSDLDS